MKIVYFTYCNKKNLMPAMLLADRVYKLTSKKLFIFTSFKTSNREGNSFYIKYLKADFKVNVSGHITKDCYGKISGFSELKTNDWIIYLDNDILFQNPLENYLSTVNGNIYMVDHKLPNLMMEQYNIPQMTYFNTGVIVMKGIFIDTFIKKIEDTIDLDQIYLYHDQCLINIALAQYISILPNKFNASTKWCTITGNENIHFLGPRKPWNTLFPSKSQQLFLQPYKAWSLPLRMKFNFHRISQFINRIRIKLVNDIL